MTIVEFHKPGVAALQSVLSSNALRVAALAAEARQTLTAGLLDTAVGSDLDQLADLMQVIADDLAELRDSVIAADQWTSPFSGPPLAGFETILNLFSAPMEVEPQELTDEELLDLLKTDPAAVANAWLKLSPIQKRLVASTIALEPTKSPSLRAAVDAWKKGLNSTDLNQHYLDVALVRADIDIRTWDPSKGFEANKETVEKVYTYYGELFASDSKTFVWAGMAAMIGPSFVAGMEDLPKFAEMLSDPKVIATLEAAGVTVPTIPPGLATGGLLYTAEELKWFETQFLKMQQQIFFDMAPKHEAFLDGGSAAVARIVADEPDQWRLPTVQAFRDMENGVNLESAGATLLRREQERVIGTMWDEMRNRAPLGPPLTYMMTTLGTPSIPGAKGYAEVFPLEAHQHFGVSAGPDWITRFNPFPHLTGSAGIGVAVELPFPDGNVSYFDDRWRLITDDTYPAYIEFISKHPDEAVKLATTSAVDRSQKYRVDVEAVVKAMSNFNVDPSVHNDLGWDWGVADNVVDWLNPWG